MVWGWQWLVGKEKGNPGRFVPPGPVIRLCLWLLTPGIGCLPLRALVSQKNPDEQHRGQRRLRKRKHTELSAAAEEGEGHLKYRGRRGGAVLCPSWVPCSLEQNKEHHFPSLEVPRLEEHGKAGAGIFNLGLWAQRGLSKCAADPIPHGSCWPLSIGATSRTRRYSSWILGAVLGSRWWEAMTQRGRTSSYGPQMSQESCHSGLSCSFALLRVSFSQWLSSSPLTLSLYSKFTTLEMSFLTMLQKLKPHPMVPVILFACSSLFFSYRTAWHKNANLSFAPA